MSLYDLSTLGGRGLWPRAQPPAFARYGVALFLVGLSALVGLWYRTATYHSPYLFFYAAILISLLYGGFGAGLASTFLSALLVNYLFQPPYGQFSYDLSSLVRGTYFCISFGLICWLVDTRRKAVEGQIYTQRQLLDIAAAPVIMCDEDDRITYWNKAAEAVYGWKEEEAIGQCITELLHTVLPDPIQNIKSQLTSVGQWSGELRRTKKDGSAAFVASSWTLRRSGRHGIIRLESDHDLTEQRKAEEQLHVSEHQFRTMANAMPQLAWMANPDGWIFWYNQKWYEYTGTTPQQMEGWGWQSVHDPAELPKVMERWKATIATNEPFEMVFPLRSMHGEYRAFLTRVSPIKDASGKVLRWLGTNTDVDEQKRTEEALIDSQKRLAGIVGSAMDAIITLDEQQRIVLFNAAAERMFRCKEAEALGEPIERFIPERFRAAHAAQIRDFGETNVTNRTLGSLGGLWALRADGEEFQIEASISSVERGGKKLFTVILRDITERKQIEDNLRISEDRYRDLVENSQDFLCTHDLDGNLLSANQVPARVLGYEVAELLNTPMRDIIAPEFREQFDQYLVRLKNHGADKGLMTVLTRSGERRIWEYYNTLRTEGVPAPTVRGMAHDVTERKRAETALKEREEQLRLFVEYAPAALAMFDREMRYLSVSRRWRADYGLGDRDLHGVSHYEVFPELPERWKAAHRRGLAGEVLREDDDRFERADGSVQSVAWEVRPWHDPRGGVGGVVIVTEDITQRKQAQENLRISEERLRLAVRVAAMGIWELRFPTRTLIWAPEVRDIFGVPADAPQPSFEDAARFTHPEDRSRVEEQMVLLLAGKPIQIDHRINRPDGGVRWIEVTGKAEFDEAGQPVRCLGVIRDVTERHQLEGQFLQSQKMDAVGRLSGGVAHDFNNVLMIITGYADLLKDRVGSDERLRPMIEAILKAANRAASLTHQLLAFSRKQILSPKILDLNSVLADLDKMLPRLIGDDIDLEMVPGNGLGRVMADASQIQQVVMNLVVNARDAMPDGGRLTIETANAEWDEKSGQEYGMEAKAGSFVLLSVADNGMGMDRETRAHLFEPFFTTKSVDKGTGLGLSIVYGVVKQSGGFIRVDSQPGQGTTFKIYLPRIEAKETVTSATNAPPQGRRGSETILLVEDEQGVREAISHFLRGQGYTVLEALNPRVATEIAREQGKQIHLLLTDITMPGMNGQELAKQLKSNRPEMRVLYISGYTDRAIAGGTKIDANSDFLQKPFGFDVLGRMLRDILER